MGGDLEPHQLIEGLRARTSSWIFGNLLVCSKVTETGHVDFISVEKHFFRINSEKENLSSANRSQLSLNNLPIISSDTINH